MRCKLESLWGNQYSEWQTKGHGNKARLILGHENETSQPFEILIINITHPFPEKRPPSYKNIAFNYAKEIMFCTKGKIPYKLLTLFTGE